MIVENPLPKAKTGSDLGDDRSGRRTVIPSPRGDAMFSGWGVRF